MTAAARYKADVIHRNDIKKKNPKGIKPILLDFSSVKTKP